VCALVSTLSFQNKPILYLFFLLSQFGVEQGAGGDGVHEGKVV